MQDKVIKEIILGANGFLGNTPNVCACCGKMGSFPSKTIMYTDGSKEIIGTPMHSGCDSETLKKIRDYSYLDGNEITAETISNVLGISRNNANRIYNYYYKTGVLEVIQNDSSKEALDEYLNKVDKTNSSANDALLVSSLNQAADQLRGSNSQNSSEKQDEGNRGYRTDLGRWRR